MTAKAQTPCWVKEGPLGRERNRTKRSFHAPQARAQRSGDALKTLQFILSCKITTILLSVFTMAKKGSTSARSLSGANPGFEVKLSQAAGKLRHVGAFEYKHAVLGDISLKYIGAII